MTTVGYKKCILCEQDQQETFPENGPKYLAHQDGDCIKMLIKKVEKLSSRVKSLEDKNANSEF